MIRWLRKRHALPEVMAESGAEAACRARVQPGSVRVGGHIPPARRDSLLQVEGIHDVGRAQRVWERELGTRASQRSGHARRLWPVLRAGA